MSPTRGDCTACLALVICATITTQLLMIQALTAQARRKLARAAPLPPLPDGAERPAGRCVVLGHACDCPQGTELTPSHTREAACAILRGRTVLFAGDSLARDAWSAAGLWLLDEEVSRMPHTPALSHNQACMACAWKFAPEIWAGLKASGSLTEVLTPHKSVSTLRACAGTATLIFKYARLFSDAQSVAEELRDAPGPAAAKVLVITAGILEMAAVRTDVAAIRAWVAQVEGHVHPLSQTIFMGAHARIPDLSPIAFRSDAYGWQGNAQIRLWTAAVTAARQRLTVVDPFPLTAGLDATYRDTEDGLHFGQWINLQKLHMLLAEINATAYSS
jgi:hypothetical protein